MATKKATTTNVGTIVLFRADEDSALPALVIATKEGGPPPKGSNERDRATFADLCVFTQSGPQVHVSVREGDQVGEWSRTE